MGQKLEFTKYHTQAAKGLGIIFLVCYHCFSSESRFYGNPVSFWPLPAWAGIYIAKSMALCVGIFAFLSVYGMMRSMKKKYDNYQFTSEEGFLYVLRRYISIVMMFFIPFLFCELFTALRGIERYGTGKIERLGDFFMDMFGISSIFGTEMLIDTWWYLGFLVMVTVFMPLFVRAYCRYSWLFLFMFLIICQIFVDLDTNMTRWLFTVPVAMVAADRSILEQLRGWKLVRGEAINKFLKFLIFTLLLFLMVYIRNTDWAMKNIRFVLSAVIPLFMIHWVYEFIFDIPALGRMFCFLGKHSADIFFVHNFIRGVWYKQEVYSLKYAVIIFAVTMGGSLVLSLFFDAIRKLTNYAILTNRVTSMISQCFEKI